MKFSANADKWFSLLHFDHEMEEAETERVEDNSSLIELDIFWWKLKRKVVKINIFTFLQMSDSRQLFIRNKGYNFTRHPTIKAYQAFISPILPGLLGRVMVPWWVSSQPLYQEIVLLGSWKTLNNDCPQWRDIQMKTFSNIFGISFNSKKNWYSG